MTDKTTTTIDSSRWTGAPHALKVSRELAAPVQSPFIAILLAFVVYLFAWQGMWFATGSPTARAIPAWPIVATSVLGGFVVFFLFRNRPARWLWAIAGIAVTAMVADVTSFLLDFQLAREPARSTQFVERKSPPKIGPTRHFQLGHEVEIRGKRGRKSTLYVSEAIYGRIVGGDSCLTLVERTGILYRFATHITIRPSGDGTGHWMQVDENRRRCLTGR